MTNIFKSFLLILAASAVFACPPGEYWSCTWVEVGPPLGGFNSCTCQTDPTAPPQPDSGPCQICYDCSAGFCYAVPCPEGNNITASLNTSTDPKKTKTTPKAKAAVAVKLPSRSLATTLTLFPH